MLIKFKKPDPRDGMTARMDSSRGQHFVDAGLADRLNEDGTMHGAEKAAPTRAQLDAALEALPDGNTDAEYVKRAMRAYFGDLFTEGDAKRVDEAVKPATTETAPVPEPVSPANAPAAEATPPAPAPAPAPASRKRS